MASSSEGLWDEKHLTDTTADILLTVPLRFTPSENRDVGGLATTQTAQVIIVSGQVGLSSVFSPENTAISQCPGADVAPVERG
jgi:hypothetical protein